MQRQLAKRRRTVTVLWDVAWISYAAQEMLAGVREFSAGQTRWFLRAGNAMHHSTVPDSLPDAVIYSRSNQFVSALSGFRGPRVSMDASAPADVVIDRDEVAVGRMAARHFIDRGLRHLAFVPAGHRQIEDETSYSFRLAQGLQQAAAEAGVEFYLCPDPNGISGWLQDRPAIHWLRDLPKPVGVLAATDALAQEVIQSCRALGLNVPEEVAVLGVDNDPGCCETSHPTLSSVEIPWRRVGYLMAQWVRDLLRGKQPPENRMVLVPPTRVVTRQSTDVTAVPDRDVAVALGYIREHACEGLSIKELLASVPVVRRRLERATGRYLGRTPLEEIRRVQVEQACRLLAQTDLPMPQVAARCGMPQKYFYRLFHEAVGTTPTDYRRERRHIDAG